MIGPLTLAGALAALLVLWAISGPTVIERSAATLSRVPRLAVALLLASGLFWVVALLTVALVLAWTAAGPALLPGRAAEVCQRCVAEANPFTGGADTALSPAMPLVAALTLTTTLAIVALARSRQRWRVTAREVGAHLAGAERRTLLGHTVVVLDDARPRAFALPSRQGGIAVSRGALDRLDDDALAAVLAHEQAHVRQHHHLLASAVEALCGPLRWIPLFRAITVAVPLYLELAADDAARRSSGTDALASALLQLGADTSSHLAPGTALHAAGPHRVRHLVAPEPLRQGLPALGLALGQLGLAALVSTGVLSSYLLTAVAGCGL